jgi:outer membrane lipoprotein-sorting protein
MRRLLVTFLIAALSTTAFAGDMTADDLIAKYIEASGGEKNIRGTKSLFFKGSVFMGGTALDMKMWIVPPDKAYTEVSMANTVMGGGGCNGDNAWAVQMGQAFYLEGEMAEDAKRQADMFPLLDYKDKDFKVNYVGEATVKGEAAHKMAFVHPKGDTAYYFFDATTFHLVKKEDKGTTTSLSKYKEVGGLVWPHKLSVSTPQGQQMITFDSIAVNTDVPDSLFVMPEGAKPVPGMHTPPADSAQPADSGK